MQRWKKSERETGIRDVREKNRVTYRRNIRCARLLKEAVGVREMCISAMRYLTTPDTEGGNAASLI